MQVNVNRKILLPWIPKYLHEACALMTPKIAQFWALDKMPKVLLFCLSSEGFAPTNLVLLTLSWTWLFVNCNSQLPSTAAVDARRLFNWLSSFIEAGIFPGRSWCCCTIFAFFSFGKVKVMSAEFISKPETANLDMAGILDLLTFIKTPGSEEYISEYPLQVPFPLLRRP